MSPFIWLLNSLGALRGRGDPCWGAECPNGTPVPTPERCTAVDCDSVRLTTLAEGERGRVTCLEEPASGPSATLAAMGVLPGTELVLLQRYPAFVFRIGYSELALDAELAGRVRVQVFPHEVLIPAS